MEQSLYEKVAFPCNICHHSILWEVVTEGVVLCKRDVSSVLGEVLNTYFC